MSILHYVPIIHSIEDCGSLGSAIQRAFSEKKRRVAFDEFQKEIHRYWQIAEKRINEAIPDARGLVVYQDSLPVGDREKVFAFFGYMRGDHPESPNFRLVKNLLDRGAVLEGTEDMNLVMAQLKICQCAAEALSCDEQAKILAANKEILRLRDKFIAERIQDTLSESGKGILFIGRDHDVVAELERLPKKITIIYL